MRELRVQSNGLDFVCLEEGEGPLVLCFHGFPDTANAWEELLPEIAAAGFRAVAPHMRGYAPTGIPADGDYTLRALGGDVLGLIDALGYERATVVGHDWGASAVLTAAALDPGKIERLALVAIPPPTTIKPTLGVLWGARHFLTFQWRSRTLAKATRDPRGFNEMIYRRWSPTWDFDPSELDDIVGVWANPDALEAAFAYYWALPKDGRDKEVQELVRRKITVPGLVVGGLDDGALAPEHWQRATKAFDAPARLEMIRGAGHFPHREKPEEFRAILIDWLLEGQGA